MNLESKLSHGHLYIASAPSGTGKTSLVKALADSDERIVISVSHTTRVKRVAERDGAHYFFVTEDQFRQMQLEGEFLESAEVFGALYGTSREAVQEHIDRGYDVILEIDWQGAKQVRESWSDVTSLFVVPPSTNELRARLMGRAQDSAEVVELRMAAALSELSHFEEFDYLIVNDNFESAVNNIGKVVAAIRENQSIELPDVYPTIARMLSEAS